jgi:putative phosphoribosyl transferase
VRLFRNRHDAGRQLAEALADLAGEPNLIVLALPRGGVPVGYEIARALPAELDVLVVRKLGVPGQEELAMGAIASGGVRVVNEEVRQWLRIPDATLDRVAEREAIELARRERLYRGDRPPAPVADRTVVLVDDGLATGSTMRAAALAVRMRHPRRIVIAVPVAAPDTCRALEEVADQVRAVATPEPFYAVGQWYEEFSQLSDEEVRELIERAQSGWREVGEPHRQRS